MWWRTLERSPAGYLIAAAVVAALTASLKLLGGRIRAESRAVGAGARITFTFPIGDEDGVIGGPRQMAAAATGEGDGVL